MYDIEIGSEEEEKEVEKDSKNRSDTTELAEEGVHDMEGDANDLYLQEGEEEDHDNHGNEERYEVKADSVTSREE